MPWDPPKFVADSVISQSDRQDVAHVYRGILATFTGPLLKSKWFWTTIIAASAIGIGVALWLML